MRELPTGTVTLLFTDIEGSTELLHGLGAEQYADVLEEHRRVLRAAFERHRGVEVDTQGDAFFVAFERAGSAAAAAVEAIDALGDGPVRVRIGLHTGEPIVRGSGYVGADVHRAARIMSAAHGGQVLASQTTYELLTDGVTHDLGVHRLKDVGELRLFQLGDGDFPPLRSLNNSNLPVVREPLLGRKRELADLLRLFRVDGTRLVTLTGPGGTGKTRLALEVAGELGADFDDGVWFVDLSAVRDPELVMPTVVTVLGVRGPLFGHISGRELLIVVDNFEQVIDAASEIGALLSSSEHARLLVTSREPLRIAGEREYPLRPLAEAPAVELFRQRARAAGVSDDSDYAGLAELCARLDRLPLAIELAAARARTVSPGELRSRLTRRLPLLTRGRRDAPERQRTLRATIEWSHELCSDDERRLFRQLAVFAGGWSLAAAEAVCSVELDDLDSLVEKSLVRREDGRYSMLETIREFAAEQLDAAPEAEEVRRRHAEWILDLANSANLTVENEGEQHHAWISAELENVRAALDWTLASGELELGLRIAFALENWWVSAGPPREGTRWTSELLERAGNAPDELRAQALRVLGNNAATVGDIEAGVRLYEQSLQTYRDLEDERGTAIMLVRVAFWALELGDFERARGLIDELLGLLGRTRLRRLEPQALTLQAELAFADGATAKAVELAEQAATAAAEIAFTWWQAGALETLAEWLLELGRLDEAASRAREALALAVKMNDRQRIVFGLARLAGLAAKPGLAGRLWGAVEAEEARGEIGQWEAARERYWARASAAAGESFEAARLEGQHLTLEQAAREGLADALESIDKPT